MDTFEAVLRQHAHPYSESQRLYIRELDGVQGRPDLIVAEVRGLPKQMDIGTASKCLASPAKACILAFLRYGAHRRLTYLERVTGLTKRPLLDHLARLEECGLVNMTNGFNVSLAYPLPWSMVNIAAYEGKLSNWRRALDQAITYRMFSQSVRIVMPSAGARRAKQLSALFKNSGIGLIAIKEGGQTHVEIPSRNLRPRSRPFYLMAVGIVLKQLDRATLVHTPDSDLNLLKASSQSFKCEGPVSVENKTNVDTCAYAFCAAPIA